MTVVWQGIRVHEPLRNVTGNSITTHLPHELQCKGYGGTRSAAGDHVMTDDHWLMHLQLAEEKYTRSVHELR
jgi:hypothetical protein